MQSSSYECRTSSLRKVLPSILSRNHSSVLVCGAGYGKTYALAAANASDFHLLGILSRGSRKSAEVARSLKTKLYQDVADLPEDIFLACVAVGGPAGCDLVRTLLTRGANVILEHPVAPEELRSLQSHAAAACRHIYVNYHFADLAAPQHFIKEYLRRHELSGRPHFVSCIATLRTIHSLADMLIRCGLVGDPKILRAFRAKGHSPINYVDYLLNEVPVSVIVLEVSAADDGQESSIGHRISATFRDCTLILANTTGPVLWTNSVVASAPTRTPLWQYSYGRPSSVHDYAVARQEANVAIMRRVRGLAFSVKNSDHEAHQLAAARLAYRLLAALAAPT